MSNPQYLRGPQILLKALLILFLIAGVVSMFFSANHH